MSYVLNYLKDEEGAAAAEYALILALVCVAIAGVLGTLSTNVKGAITAAANAV